MPGEPSQSRAISAPTAVIGLVVALVAALVLILAVMTWRDYNGVLANIRQRSESSVRIVGSQVEWLAGASRQSLKELERLAGTDAANAPDRLETAMQALLLDLPYGIQATVTDLDGRVISSTAKTKTTLTPEDGLDFTALKASPDWYLSPAVLSESSDPFFLIARIIRRNGVDAGAAILTVPFSVMTGIWSSLELGAGSTVGLMRDDGWLVARFPPVEKPVNLKDYVLFTDHLKRADNGSYEAISPVDGEHRIVGYRRVGNAPLITVASIPVAGSMATFWRNTMLVWGMTLLLVAGVLTMMAWLVRVLRRDERLRLQLADAVARNTMLFREIHHRVKNNLQTVSSLIQLQPIPAESKRDMTARIAAMSAVHQQAYSMDQFTQIDLSTYMKALLDNIRTSYGDSVVIESQVQPLIVDRDSALPLGLIVNEVITNAMKHAFTATTNGHVDVSIMRLNAETGELRISDNGPGYVPSKEDRGMGSRLIRALVRQLGNDYGYSKENGTTFHMRFPLSAEV